MDLGHESGQHKEQWGLLSANLGLGSNLSPKPKTNIGKSKTYLHHKIGPNAPTQAQAQTSSSSQLAPPRAWLQYLRHLPTAAAATSPRRNNCQRMAADAHRLLGASTYSFPTASSASASVSTVTWPSSNGATRVEYDTSEIEGVSFTYCMPSRVHIKRLSALSQSDSGCLDRHGSGDFSDGAWG